MQIDHIFGWLIITDQDIITVLLSSSAEVSSESGGDVAGEVSESGGDDRTDSVHQDGGGQLPGHRVQHAQVAGVVAGVWRWSGKIDEGDCCLCTLDSDELID